MKLFLPLFLLLSITVHAQKLDYTQYYQWMNQAREYSGNDDFFKADSVSNLALTTYNGFADDYAYGIYLRNKLTQQVDTAYFISMVQNGELWLNAKFTLERVGVSNYKDFKKLYRKNKFKKTINGYPVARLIVRDQLSRSKFNFLVRKNADSINLVKLERLLIKKPDLFDRNKVGRFANLLLNPLMAHQSNWETAQRIFYPIRDNIKQGKLHPDLLLATIHRASTADGTLFWVENDSLHAQLNGNKKICIYPTVFYGLIHGGELRIRMSEKTGLMPLNPDFSMEQINQLRNYLFLSDFDTAFPDSRFCILSEDEFCTALNLNRQTVN